MQNSEPLPDLVYTPHESPGPELCKRLATWALSAALVLTSAAHSDPIREVFHDARVQLSDCPPPSNASLQAVTNTFDKPWTGPSSYPGESRSVQRERLDAYENNLVRKLGIKMPIYDGDRLMSLDLYPGQPNKPAPFADYLAETRAILAQSGIPVSLGPPESVQAKTPTPQELETYNAKYQMLELINMFRTAPINLTAHMGIKEIALTAHGEVSRSFGGYAGLALTSEGILIIDLVNAGNADEVPEHELTHLVAASLCRAIGADINDDPGYAALNNDATYARQWPLPTGFLAREPKTFSDIEDMYSDLEIKLLNAGDRGDRVAYCTYQRAINQLLSGVEVTSPYDYTDVAEDQANLGKYIFDQFGFMTMLDPAIPIVRKKFLYFLAKFYQKYPEVLKYYAGMYLHPLAQKYACGQQVASAPRPTASTMPRILPTVSRPDRVAARMTVSSSVASRDLVSASH